METDLKTLIKSDDSSRYSLNPSVMAFNCSLLVPMIDFDVEIRTKLRVLEINDCLKKCLHEIGIIVNQEDSVMLNKSAVERGLFDATSYRTLTCEEKKRGSYSTEQIGLPPEGKRLQNANYSLLDENGIVRKRIGGKNVYVDKGDVIVAKMLIKSNKSNEEEIFDCSMVIKSGEEGYVDRVFVSITPNGYKLIKIIIRNQRIPEIGDKFACYSDDTDILTKTGWKNVSEITVEDKVACLVEENSLMYINPVEVQSYDYEGKMYQVESDKVSLCVTPNHRMYTGNCNRKTYVVKTAEEIYGKMRSYKNNVDVWEPVVEPGNLVSVGKENYFILPGYENLPDLELNLEAWCLFFGIWMAEGSCSARNRENGNVWYRAVNIAANKQRVRDQLEKCMEILGIDWSLHMSKGELVSWYSGDLRLIYYLHPLSVGAINKSLPDWCFQLDMHHTRKLIEGMVLGDGNYMKGTTTQRYYTSSIKLRDDFQKLCLHAGWGCNYYLKSEKGTQSKILGRTITTNADYWNLTIVKTQTNPLVNKYIKQGKQLDSWVDYNGKVYCCTVPTEDGIIFVRRNGKSIWAGNSRSAQKGVCLRENSLVSLSNGNSVKIKDMKISDTVWGTTGSGLRVDECLNVQYMGKKQTIKITFQNGEEIVCTPDHRILTKEGWKEAQTLTEDDLVAGNLQFPEDIRDEDEIGWTLDMSYSNHTPERMIFGNVKCPEKTTTMSLVLNMETDHERERSLAFARVLGFILADGWICRYSNRPGKFRAGVALGTLIDAEIFIKDVNTLIKDKKACGKNVVCAKSARFYDSKSYAGACYVYDLPTYLARCFASLPGILLGKRILCKPTWPEFLKTAPKSILREFLGGLFGGDGCAPHFCRKEIHCVEFMWKTLKSNIEESIIHIKFLKKMLKKCGVASSITKPCDRPSEAKDGEQRTVYGLHLRRNAEFADKIGFRYSMYKQCRLSAATTFWKMRAFLDKPHKTKSWMEKTGTENWFEKGTYCVGRSSTEIPYYFLPIHEIENGVVEKVYDITVNNVSSFIANGIVVHNCGFVYDQEDLPFTSEGIVPDIVINPACIPSRMTVNQLMECVLGKACVMEGNFGDATPFMKSNENIMQDICERLSNVGFEKHGWEKMYNGFTGEMMDAQIYIGPTYYQRLKHMVSDKIHSRSSGHVTTLTRQPLEGRSREGGLKFGEMERDAIIGHGASRFLKESLFDKSDPYQVNVCDVCGCIANTPTECKSCNTDSISRCNLPYAAKLLFQELGAMGLRVSIKSKTN